MKDLEMMQHPERWPICMTLPLRHKTRRDPDGSNFPLLGFLFEDAETEQAVPKVYVGCIDQFITGELAIDQIQVEEYASLEALVEAGWRVD
jgi:hypothetical protein